ncbi:MAG: nuclear transport factor 2 family protein [Thermomicrobiales bacterium]|nr:nuclear transport factor 2 family protein [Thermomicrobiales bacterium]
MATTEEQTVAVMTAHVQALGQGIDDIMRHYTEESVVFAPEGPCQGLVQIQAYYEAFLATRPDNFLKRFTVVRQDVIGEIAYVIWKAQPFVLIGTDTFIVRDGKIVLNTFWVNSPLANLAAARERVKARATGGRESDDA